MRVKNIGTLLKGKQKQHCVHLLARTLRSLMTVNLASILLTFVTHSDLVAGRETASLMSQFSQYDPGTSTNCDNGAYSTRACNFLDQTATGFQCYTMRFEFDQPVTPQIRLDLTSVKEIRTVHLHASSLNTGEIRIGNDQTYSNNPVCATQITDSGWYECSTPLEGQYIFLKRIVDAAPANIGVDLVVYSVRAYKGINVAQWATVVKESMTVEPQIGFPVPAIYSGSNLLTMSPRKYTERDTTKTNPQSIPGNTLESGPKIYSCAYYAWSTPSDPANDPIELTIKLDYPYLVDALFYAGDPAKITEDKVFLAGPF